jgi:hypothetical protein
MHALQGLIGPERGFACKAQPDAEHAPSRGDVAAYFCRRKQPRFFVDVGKVAELANLVSVQHPQWRERLLKLTASERTDGPQIYCLRGPPLQPGFPWGELPDGANDDDLYAVRPHRFAFAPRQALAAVYGQASAGVLADLLEDWMHYATHNASPMPYASSLVVIQRLLALSWAHAFAAALSDKEDPDAVRLQIDILRIIRADIGFLLPRLGQSAPNNHLLADRFAAWYIRLLFPEFVPGPMELNGHEVAWLAELDRQVYADGTGFEPALHYHEFGCEMAVAYLLLNHRNSRHVPGATLRRIERMLDFQVALAESNGLTVAFGDAIEDPLFPLDCGQGWATGGLRELYRALFRPELSPALPSTPSVERAFWLLGGELAAPQEAVGKKNARRARFWPDGGFGIFPDETSSAKLVFRTGPAEHHHLAAGHMHADLLSVYVSAGTQAVLVDAGTPSYRYHGSGTSSGRAYFAGPAAHNGLSLESIDPLGAVVGDFRKRRSVQTRIRTTQALLGDGFAWLEAEVRGPSVYAGYRRGVVHIHGSYWVIYDWLPPGRDDYAASFSFQTAPDTRIVNDKAGLQWLQSADETFWLANGPGLEEPENICGQSDPLGGWVAPQYGETVPAPQLRYRAASQKGLTAFVLGAGAEPKRPISIQALGTGMAIRIEGDETQDILLLAICDELVRVATAEDYGATGALWLKRTQGQSRMLRCLGYRELEQADEPSRVAGSPESGIPVFRTNGNSQELERRDPKNLSISFAGLCW